MPLPVGMPLETKIALAAHASRGVRLSIGEYSYGTPTLFYNDGDPSLMLSIGAFCSIADDVKIFLGRFGRHHYDFLSTYPMGMVFGSPSKMDTSASHSGDLGVSVGSDVWIARSATIMAGVRIGHGAVIGACSLVTHDVKPYAIMGGVPAKPLKMRFNEDHVERLLRIRWWEWPSDKLRNNIDLFYSADIDEVLRELEKHSATGTSTS
jgi:acetyltransferase-like isoleucine patch superfamily enzyme